jgi:uncharacterized membrane protein YhaH (DUF805 family)
MRIHYSDLWRSKGEIDGPAYAILGLFLFLIKSQVDRFVAYRLFHQAWSLWNYIVPVDVSAITTIRADLRPFYLTLVAIAIPFVYSGIVLTLRRLRAARMPLWLIVLFFVPVINLFFFVLLSLVPSLDVPPNNTNEVPRTQPRTTDRLGLLIPKSTLGSALAGIFATLVLSTVATLVSTELFHEYGFGLFLGLPFCLGFTSVLIYGYHERRGKLECFSVAMLALLLSAAGLLLFAIEGAGCLIMAAPLAVPLAWLGSSVAYYIHLTRHPNAQTSRALLGVILLLPSFMGAEHLKTPEPPLLSVSSAVDIDAPPSEVWKHVITFSPLPEPTDFVFRMGVAYPQRAEIIGRGPGAIRRCVFSTGAFVEPIEIWDEPRLLKFSVTDNPPAMQEWTFYSAVHPPHLHGFLVSSGGQFLLTPLPGPGNRTRLEGTTWYRHSMWPVGYWRIWSDLIIHRIHLQVLNHVKHLTEGDVHAESQP